MQIKTYKNGMGAMVKAFPGLSMDLDFYWRFLKDLPDESFLHGIESIIMNHVDIYPGTNIIALIRENAFGKNEKISNSNMFIEYKEPEYQEPDEEQLMRVHNLVRDCVSKLNKN